MKCIKDGVKLKKIVYQNNVYYVCPKCGWSTKASKEIEDKFGSLAL